MFDMYIDSDGLVVDRCSECGCTRDELGTLDELLKDDNGLFICTNCLSDKHFIDCDLTVPTDYLNDR